MTNVKAKKRTRNVLTNAQTRLLRESIKQLLGPSLGQSQPHLTEREQRALFLRDALNSKVLDSEWLS